MLEWAYPSLNGKHDSIMIQLNTQLVSSVKNHTYDLPPEFRKMDSQGISREAREFCTALLNSHSEQHSVEQDW